MWRSAKFKKKFLLDLDQKFANPDSPVVTELEGQSSVVTSLHYNDISEEVRAQEQAQGSDNIGPLRLASGER